MPGFNQFLSSQGTPSKLGPLNAPNAIAEVGENPATPVCGTAQKMVVVAISPPSRIRKSPPLTSPLALSGTRSEGHVAFVRDTEVDSRQSLLASFGGSLEDRMPPRRTSTAPNWVADLGLMHARPAASC